ncbi:MAG: MFS transporter [Chloroflexota bacterium]
MIHSKRGMGIFSILWIGQVVSVIGSSLTGFALGVWVYQQSGSITQFTLISLAAMVPGILVSPIAGALVDRWNRRWTMILSDACSALVTLSVFLLLRANQLALWHLGIAAALISIFNAFQMPAYHAATTMLVPKQQLGKASGMTQAGQALGQLVAPALAGALLVNVQLVGVVLVDFATFFVALITMFAIRIPEVDDAKAAVEAGAGANAEERARESTEESTDTKTSLFGDILFGWRYLYERRGLLALLGFFAVGSFLVGFVGILITPLVLSFESADTLGLIMTIGGLGMLVGSIGLGAFDGSSNRIRLILGFALASSLFVMMLGSSTWPVLLTISAFFYLFCSAMISGNSRVIMQKKVAPEVQGRVFALATAVPQATTPLAYLLAGPLADYVFEPLMAVDGPLANSAGQLIGVGTGRGIGLLMILIGILMVLFVAIAYRNPRLRNLEEELPDVEIFEEPSQRGDVEQVVKPGVVLDVERQGPQPMIPVVPN